MITIYVPENYSGEMRRAYDVGRQQIEETCHEEGINLFNDTEKVIPESENTITPDGMPTDEQWASYFKDVS